LLAGLGFGACDALVEASERRSGDVDFVLGFDAPRTRFAILVVERG
jgi:hypothetical protein